MVRAPKAVQRVAQPVLVSIGSDGSLRRKETGDDGARLRRGQRIVGDSVQPFGILSFGRRLGAPFADQFLLGRFGLLASLRPLADVREAAVTREGPGSRENVGDDSYPENQHSILSRPAHNRRIRSGDRWRDIVQEVKRGAGSWPIWVFAAEP